MKFSIGQYQVDSQRCSICLDEQITTLEPKVMEVLLYLQQHSGQVLSQQQIFEHVWPNAVFNPSSVQRAIALLRKALGEDSKQPTFIHTYPKRGYCLQLPELVTNKGEQSSNSDSDSFFIRYGAMLFGIVILCLLVSLYWQPKNQLRTDYHSLSPITSHQSSESDLSISPDGQYLAFVRHLAPSVLTDDHAEQKRQVWIRHLASSEELLISEHVGLFRHLSWTDSGRAISYFEQDEQRYRLHFAAVDLVEPRITKRDVLSEFDAAKLHSVARQWSKDNKLYWVQYLNDEHSQLVEFDLISTGQGVLNNYHGKELLLELALSNDQRQLALGVNIHGNQYRIDRWALSDNEATTVGLVENRLSGIAWHPSDHAILLSNESGLLLFDLTGNLKEITFDNYHHVTNAHYGVDEDTIYIELQQIDIDIVQRDMAFPARFDTVVDTRSLDFLPIYSPDASKFVFESRRSGLKQLYLYQQGKQSLIFDNPDNQEMFGVAWSADGAQVMAATKDKLYQIDLATKQYQVITHNQRSFYLRDWFANRDALLASIVTEQGLKPVVFDLQSKQLSYFEHYQETYQCTAMALDEDDNIFLSDSRSIYRVNGKQSVSPILQLETGHISGINASQGTLSVKVDGESRYQIINVDLATDKREQVISAPHDETYWLINSASDSSKFLYLTRPKRYRSLVKLN